MSSACFYFFSQFSFCIFFFLYFNVNFFVHTRENVIDLRFTTKSQSCNEKNRLKSLTKNNVLTCYIESRKWEYVTRKNISDIAYNQIINIAIICVYLNVKFFFQGFLHIFVSKSLKGSTVFKGERKIMKLNSQV